MSKQESQNGTGSPIPGKIISKEEIIEVLESNIHNIISYVMDQENVTTGDVSPMQIMEYNRLIEQLADYVRIIVDQNKAN